MSLNPGKRLKVEEGSASQEHRPNEEEAEYPTQQTPSSPAREAQSASRGHPIDTISGEEVMDVFGTYRTVIQSFADQIPSQPRNAQELARMCDKMEFSAQTCRRVLERDYGVSRKRQYFFTHVYSAHFEDTFRAAISHARQWSEKNFPGSIALVVHKGPWEHTNSSDAENFNTQYFSATEEQWKIFIESPNFGFDHDTAAKLAAHLGHEKWPILKAATNMPSMLVQENEKDKWKLVEAKARLWIKEVPHEAAHASLLIGRILHLSDVCAVQGGS